MVDRRIEPVSRAAAGAVSLMHRACFPDDPWDLPAVEQIMSVPGFFGCIGWEGHEPAGFALALSLGKEAEILSLAVLREHRRRGLGSTFLRTICAEALMRGADCVLLEVAVDNGAARALYAASGFIVAGHRRNYYRQAGHLVDALILRFSLATAAPPI